MLFNNAGISPNDDASVLETSLEAWERVQRVNLRSVFLCCKHGIPHILENDGPSRGSVINTASFVALMGRPHRRSPTRPRRAACLRSRASWASSSPGAVCASTRSAPDRWTRRCCSELFAKDPEKAARRLVHLPMGRFARAEEIANGVLFLASDESSYVTASTFLLDGGLSGAYTTPLD